MRRGEFLKGLALALTGGAAASVSAQPEAPEGAKVEVEAVGHWIEVPVTQMVGGDIRTGVVAFQPDGTVIEKPNWYTGNTGVLWRNARSLGRTYEPRVG